MKPARAPSGATRRSLQIWIDRQLDRERREQELVTSASLETFRRGVIAESIDALLLARQFGVQLPDERPAS